MDKQLSFEIVPTSTKPFYPGPCTLLKGRSRRQGQLVVGRGSRQEQEARAVGSSWKDLSNQQINQSAILSTEA